MSYTRSDDQLAAPRRRSSSRISSASRLSISVQLVDVADDVDARARERRQRCAPAGARTLRASSNRPLDCSGSPQQSCLGTSTAKPLCSSSATVISPSSRLVVVRAAAVEVGDLAPGRRARGACAPSAGTSARRTSAPGASRWMPTSFSTSDAAAAGCRASSSRSARPASRAGPASVGRAIMRSRSVTPFWRLSLRARLRVDLGDVHALRAHLRADAAAGAVVERRVGATARRRRGSARTAGPRTSGPGTAA